MDADGVRQVVELCELGDVLAGEPYLGGIAEDAVREGPGELNVPLLVTLRECTIPLRGLLSIREVVEAVGGAGNLDGLRLVVPVERRGAGIDALASGADAGEGERGLAQRTAWHYFFSFCFGRGRAGARAMSKGTSNEPPLRMTSSSILSSCSARERGSQRPST